MKRGQKKKRGWLIAALCLILVLGGSFFYMQDYYRGTEEAAQAFRELPADIRAENSGRTLLTGQLVFAPEKPLAGLIYYPGGKVEPEAYAPFLRALAEEGLLCVLPKMPGNLAVLDAEAASSIIEAHPEITDWYIAGHSLGGAMAAVYAGKHPEQLKGLILLAAYSTKDLSDTGLQILSIYGTSDGVMNRKNYDQNREKLGQGLTELVLEGGCHSYFGYYGMQEGDGTPTISREQQLQQTAAAILELIRNTDR